MDKHRKHKPAPRVATGEPDRLTHSPFAQLSSTAQPVEAPPPSAAEAEHESPQPGAAPASPTPRVLRGRLVLRRETKRRGGKAVIIVAGFAAESELDAASLEALASELKQTLGCGGSVDHRGDQRELVLQGDRPARVAELLRAKGFKVGGVIE